MDARARRPSARDWRVMALLVATYAVALVVGAATLLPDLWPRWLALAALGPALLVGWHARSFAYRCGACGHVVQVSALVDFVSPQGIDRDGQGQVRGWKLLRCPACHAWRRCSVVRAPARGNGARDEEP
jgi:hypothetical protein